MNILYYGDNLRILQEHIADESVDLIYLDPPFNSNRSYNVLFKDEIGKDAEAQITAFEDTWHWNQYTEETYEQLVTGHEINMPPASITFKQAVRESSAKNVQQNLFEK